MAAPAAFRYPKYGRAPMVRQLYGQRRQLLVANFNAVSARGAAFLGYNHVQDKLEMN